MPVESENLVYRPASLVLFFLALVSCSNEPLLEECVKSSPSGSDYRLDEYVGAQTCAECHSEAHVKWTDSHHYHAMEIPSEETVRADFNDSVFENYGITTKFFRDDGKYMVETENQDGTDKLSTVRVLKYYSSASQQ